MDGKEVRDIEDQARTVMRNIAELETQITSYRSGSEAFIKSSEALDGLAKQQIGLTSALQQVVSSLEQVEAAGLMKKIDDLSERISQLDADITKRLNDIEHILTVTGTKIKLRR